MIIPQIANQQQNFNSFIGWKNKSGRELNEQEIYTLNRIQRVLDNKQSKHINIAAEIIEPTDKNPRKRVRFNTSPLLGDIMKIRTQPGRKKAVPKDYLRSSSWFLLDNALEWEAIQYINRQINYIKYCTKDPNHNSTVIRKH